MAWSHEVPYSHYGRPGWLPPGGHGNGLDAAAWVQLLDVEEHLVDPLLRALLIAEVPAHAAPRPMPIAQRFRSRRAPVWRLWVEVWTRAYAEEVVRRELVWRHRKQ